MSKWDRQFNVGDKVEMRSALLWLLWNENLPAGARVNNDHEVVLDGVVTDKRSHACDSYWWGYTIQTNLGEFRTCGRSLDQPKKK